MDKETKFVSESEMAEIKEKLVKELGKETAEKVIPKLGRRLAKIFAEKKVEADEEAEIRVLISLKKVKLPTEKARTEILRAMREETSEAQRSLIDLLQSLGVKDVKQFSIANGVVATLTPSQIQRVAEHEDVKMMRLSTSERVICIDDSVPLINAPSVWSLGYGGNGVRVAVIDTGIDRNHPALSGKVVDEVSTHPTQGVNVPGSHGTHCAGIIASNDATYKGVSPDVDLINVKVLTGGSGWVEGHGQPEFVITGIQEAVDRGADIISMSLGWSPILHGWECSDGYCILCEAADNAVNAGVIFVVAAGNENNDKSTSGVDTNLRCPGNARSVITIGGTDKSDQMYTNSSIGPTSYGLSKPDIIAPGVTIRSTVLTNLWDNKTGTSMSTPHVAGVCALMLEKNPTLNYADVKNFLEHTAVDLGFTQNEQGAGRLNAESAVRMVPSLRKRVLSSSGTMVVDLVQGQQVEWKPAVPCWRHPGWYEPTSGDMTHGATWIWSSHWTTQQEAQRGAIRIFRKKIDLKGTGAIVKADMKAAADNRVILIINGDIAKVIETFHQLITFDIKRYLMEDALNELTFIVINRGGHTHVAPLAVPRTNPAGLIYKLEITTQM